MNKWIVSAMILSAVFSGCNTTDSSGSEIILRNRTFSVINAVYITACANASWGTNRLKSNAVISPNANQTFPVEAGCWDVRGEFRDGGSVDFKAIEVDSKTTYTLTAAN